MQGRDLLLVQREFSGESILDGDLRLVADICGIGAEGSAVDGPGHTSSRRGDRDPGARVGQGGRRSKAGISAEIPGAEPEPGHPGCCNLVHELQPASRLDECDHGDLRERLDRVACFGGTLSFRQDDALQPGSSLQGGDGGLPEGGGAGIDAHPGGTAVGLFVVGRTQPGAQSLSGGGLLALGNVVLEVDHDDVGSGGAHRGSEADLGAAGEHQPAAGRLHGGEGAVLARGLLGLRG